MALAAAVNRLPYDIYLLIFLCLDDLRDVLALKQVCYPGFTGRSIDGGAKYT